MVNIAVLGASGRMGQTILATARDYAGVRISAALVRAGSPLLGQDAGGIAYSAGVNGALTASDVLVDFSTPVSTAAAIDACLAAGKPLVIGVTGLDAVLRHKMEKASQTIAVLAAPNMSLGVNLLLRLAAMAAAALGEEFDVEISEVHHRRKKDAPSGTALALGEAVAGARGVKLEAHADFHRAARDGMRQPGSIGFSSVRAGDIVGDHTLLFAGADERLELTHRVHSRAAFARGALVAACWIARRPAGLYQMADLLDLDTRRP